MSEWRGVSSAPFDKLVLVFEPGSGVSVAENDSEMASWYAYVGDKMAYDQMEEELAKPNPSHWMPLPEPPHE